MSKNNLNGMTAYEMINLYNKVGSFAECAKIAGCSISKWASMWFVNGCEDLMEKAKANNQVIDIKFNTNGAYTKSEFEQAFGDYVEKRINKDVTTSKIVCDSVDNRKVQNTCQWEKTFAPKYENSTGCKCDCHSDSKEYDFDSDRYEIAVISDLHLGSIYQQLTCLNNFVDICEKRGIETLLNAGDTIDGLQQRLGSKNERFLHSIDDIEEYCVEMYPDGFENNYFSKGM